MQLRVESSNLSSASSTDHLETNGRWGVSMINQAQIRLLFVTIGENTVGYGHLSRCLSLAEYAAKQKLSISFLLFGDPDAYERVNCAGFNCVLEPISTIESRLMDSALSQIERPDVIVTDFSHPEVFRCMEDARKILDRIRCYAQKLIMIDGMGAQALATSMPNMPVDILVVPYVGAIIPSVMNRLTLVGADYAVLAPPYQQLPERIVSEKPNRILVSCGGADSTRLTPLILEGLDGVSRDLDIRVIVGPLFDKDLKATLLNSVSASKHSVQLIDSPDCLVNHMLWCDLAVTTSGLIKYELAATSTPGILISIDDIHDRVNQPFADSGAIVDLGTKITSQLIEYQVLKLLDNFEARVVMAQAGRRLIDGRGAERVINEIIRQFPVPSRKQRIQTMYTKGEADE